MTAPAALCAGCRRRPPRPAASSLHRGPAPKFCAECVVERARAAVRDAARRRRRANAIADGRNPDPPKTCNDCGRYLEQPSAPRSAGGWRRICNDCRHAKKIARSCKSAAAGRRRKLKAATGRQHSCRDCGVAFPESTNLKRLRCRPCLAAATSKKMQAYRERRRARDHPDRPTRAPARPRQRACATCGLICLMLRRQRYCPACAGERLDAYNARYRRTMREHRRRSDRAAPRAGPEQGGQA